jgi:cyanate permease
LCARTDDYVQPLLTCFAFALPSPPLPVSERCLCREQEIIIQLQYEAAGKCNLLRSRPDAPAFLLAKITRGTAACIPHVLLLAALQRKYKRHDTIDAVLCI